MNILYYISQIGNYTTLSYRLLHRHAAGELVQQLMTNEHLLIAASPFGVINLIYLLVVT